MSLNHNFSGGFRAWVQGCRLFSLTASIVPVLLGAVLVPFLERKGHWGLLPLIVVASLSLHAGVNLVSEFFDFRKGVDHQDTYGSSRVLVDGLLSPRQVLLGGLMLFALCGLIGLYFVYLIGWPIFWLGVIGMLGGFFYTATPVAYKYFGLGDLLVFILMGPLMVIGSFLVLTNEFDYRIVLISLPVGFLVAGILSGNNLRDINFDTQAKIKTAAVLLGHIRARYWYCTLIVGAYGSLLAMVAMGILELWSLLPLVTIVLAVKTIKTAWGSDPQKPEAIAKLDIQTAQLHLLFGVLLIISLILGVIW